MLPMGFHNSPALMTFILMLNLALRTPQLRHITNVADALLVCEAPKTLTALNRQLVELISTPWPIASAKALGPPQTCVSPFLKRSSLRLCNGQRPWAANRSSSSMTLSLLSPRPSATSNRSAAIMTILPQPLSWQTPKKEALPKRLGLSGHQTPDQIGPFSFTVNWPLYLREKTVRRLNRSRPREKRLRFRSKPHLAQAMLQEIKPLLPQGYRVYVLFSFLVLCVGQVDQVLSPPRVARHLPLSKPTGLWMAGSPATGNQFCGTGATPECEYTLQTGPSWNTPALCRDGCARSPLKSA